MSRSGELKPPSTKLRVGLIVVGPLLAVAACTSGATPPSANPKTSTQTGFEQGQIVFNNDPLVGGGTEQIYLEQADGTGTRQLVRSQSDDHSPFLSRDGSQIVFIRGGDDQLHRIFVVNVDGSGLKQIVPAGCPGRCDDGVESSGWSPNGQQIAFTRAIFRGTSDVPTNVEIWLMNADGSQAHPLTHEDTRGGKPGGAQDGYACWSPNGKRLAFVRWTYGPPESMTIYTVAADGTDLQQVTPPRLEVADPAWSPDGTLIAFQSPPDPGDVTQNLYTIQPDGNGLNELTASLGGTATNHPSWSPDGSQLVFSHAPSGPNGGDLFIMNRDGSNIHPLAITALNENAPSWGIVGAD